MMPNIHLGPRSALSLCAALMLIIVLTLLYAIWSWYDDWQLIHNHQTSSTHAKLDTTSAMIAAIPNEHLFGESLTKIGEVPITNLQLQVTGIVKVNNEQKNSFSKAYISISDQPSKIYQIGDSLPDGVKVYAITPDAVILQNGVHLEKLLLPRIELQFKSRSKKGAT